MSCALSVAKIFFYIFNVIFGLSGLLVFVSSIYGLVVKTSLETYQSVFALIFGVIVICCFIHGCFAVKRQSEFMTWMLVVFVGILFALQIISMGRLYSKDVQKHITTLVEHSWDVHKQYPTTMTELQSAFDCCGLNGYTDYVNNNETIPLSCYGVDLNYKEVIHNAGCLQTLIDATRNNLKPIIIACWILLIIEGGVLLFSTILAFSYRRYRKTAQTYSRTI